MYTSYSSQEAIARYLRRYTDSAIHSCGTVLKIQHFAISHLFVIDFPSAQSQSASSCFNSAGGQHSAMWDSVFIFVSSYDSCFESRCLKCLTCHASAGRVSLVQSGSAEVAPKPRACARSSQFGYGSRRPHVCHRVERPSRLRVLARLCTPPQRAHLLVQTTFSRHSSLCTKFNSSAQGCRNLLPIRWWQQHEENHLSDVSPIDQEVHPRSI